MEKSIKTRFILYEDDMDFEHAMHYIYTSEEMQNACKIENEATLFKVGDEITIDEQQWVIKQISFMAWDHMVGENNHPTPWNLVNIR
jgi:hypothetical protein